MRHDRLSPSAKGLAKFRRENGIGPVDAARALGVTHPALLGWEDGSRRPNHDNRVRIREWTGGAVSEDGWGQKGNRSPVERFQRGAA